ncbi:MAG: aspartate ammonia-lyase [Candidatus Micrarchaeia archaeon]
MAFRTERDFLGSVRVPAEAYYGSFTARALANFQISGRRAPALFIRSLALIKRAAAEANMQLGLLDRKVGKAIVRACGEVAAGRFADQFPLDVFQAGAGTPFNMNVNEVIANRANELLGAPKGSYRFVHPNNHVNMSQSSNDVIPTAIRLAALLSLPSLLSELAALERSFRRKAAAFGNIVKVGRTHLQDAVPITLGQEFGAWADSLKADRRAIANASMELRVLGIGGTAVGTGITTHPRFRTLVIKHLSALTRLPLRPGRPIQLTQDMGAFARFSASLRALSLSLVRISNNLELLSMGPKAGIGELHLPDVEPGSSIMPGKVNPSIPECVEMVAFRVLANDYAVALCTQAGQLELNVNTPLIALSLLESIELLTNTCRMFRARCVENIRADVARCRELLESSLIVATALNPYLGYPVMSALVRESLRSGKTLRQTILSHNLLSEAELSRILSPASLVRPVKIDLELREKIRHSAAYREFLKKLRA